MPNIKSAKKRVRLAEKWGAQNRAKRSRIRTAMKRVLQATDSGSAEAPFKEAVSLLDRAASQRLYHPNRASRYKSRLARHVEGLGS
jgi:small subunit ribosomal protein S20